MSTVLNCQGDCQFTHRNNFKQGSLRQWCGQDLLGKSTGFANHKMDTITRGYWISHVESTWKTFSDFGCHKVCRKLNLSGSDGQSYYSLQPIESMRKRPHRLASRPVCPLKILASLIDLMTNCLFCGLLPITDRQHGLLAAVSLWN